MVQHPSILLGYSPHPSRQVQQATDMCPFCVWILFIGYCKSSTLKNEVRRRETFGKEGVESNVYLSGDTMYEKKSFQPH
jgi:hypothetical protein